jgi:hypothetical protein
VQLRPLLFASEAVVLVACVAGVVARGRGWSWPLFLAGLAVGVVSVTCLLVLNRGLLGLTRAADDAGEVLRLVEHRRTVLPLLASGALAISILAAGLDVGALIALTGFGVLLGQVLLPLAAWPATKRRLGARAAQGRR